MPSCVLRVRTTRPILSAPFEIARDGSLNYSIADGDLASQITSAINFLDTNAAELVAGFVNGSILGGAELDFGITHENKFVQSFRFPTELSALAAGCSITLCLTLYASRDD